MCTTLKIAEVVVEIFWDMELERLESWVWKTSKDSTCSRILRLIIFIVSVRLC